MKVRREIFNSFGIKISTNLITVTTCNRLSSYCDKLGGAMLDKKSFVVTRGPLLNQTKSIYSIK